jgi:hypothetical protein
MLGAVHPTKGCAIRRVHAGFIGFEKGYADNSNRELLLNLGGPLHDGLTIEGDPTPDQSENPCQKGLTRARTQLILRSRIGVMAADAQEQANFDRLNNSRTMVQSLDEGKDAPKSFDSEIPAIERMLRLRINWTYDQPTAKHAITR